MNIIHLNKYWYVRGGADTYLLDLVETQKAAGHTVAAFGMDDRRNVAIEPHQWVSPVTTDFRNGGSFWEKLRTFARMLWSWEAKRKLTQLFQQLSSSPRKQGSLVEMAVAHVHNIYHQISPSVLPRLKRHGTPVVATLHDYHLIDPTYKFLLHGKIYEQGAKHLWQILRDRAIGDSFFASLAEVVETALHRALGVYHKNIDLFIAPTQFVKDKCVEYGIPTSKIRVLHYPIIVDRYQSHYQEQTEHPFILYMGRLVEEKGVDVLLRAFQNVPEPAELVIAGSGPDEGTLKALAGQLGIAHRVRWTAYTRATCEANDMIAKAMMVIVPSTWYEVMGIVILEAYALGRPVIASRIGGIPEIVDEGKTGLLVEPSNPRALADAINRLMSDVALRKSMGARAKAYVQAFDMSKHWPKLEGIYWEAINGKNDEE